MTAILKRFLNVLALLATVYLLVLLFVATTGGISNWNEFLGINGGILAICYGTIAVVNYIAFGKATLWHKNPSAPTA
jgi:uncharacterized membrane protein (Fun14 family)